MGEQTAVDEPYFAFVPHFVPRNSVGPYEIDLDDMGL